MIRIVVLILFGQNGHVQLGFSLKIMVYLCYSKILPLVFLFLLLIISNFSILVCVSTDLMRTALRLLFS